MIERDFDVGASPRLIVSIPSGSIELVAGRSEAMGLRLEGPREEEYEIRQSGDTVTVRRPPGRMAWLQVEFGRIRLHAEVPPGTDVDISTASAEILSRVELGSARVETASGDILLDDAGELWAKTASGTISAKRISGSLTARSASGEIEAREVLGRLDATSASGSVSTRLSEGQLSASTASGNVIVDRYQGSDLNIKAISGDIRVGLPGGITVSLDAHTLSGRIDLPPREDPGGQDTNRRKVKAKLRTVSGDIEIRRLEPER